MRQYSEGGNANLRRAVLSTFLLQWLLPGLILLLAVSLIPCLVFFGYCRLSPEGFVDCREGNVVRWDSHVKTRVALKQEEGITRSSVCLRRR